jgi:hypothetical protein
MLTSALTALVPSAFISTILQLPALGVQDIVVPPAPIALALQLWLAGAVAQELHTHWITSTA